jgi:hypothetical protein
MAGELDFLQQLLQLQQNGTGFLGSTTQYRSPITVNTVLPGVQAAMSGLTGLGSAAGAASGAAGAASGAAGGATSALTSGLGLGLTAASTVMSFLEADKQKGAMREARREAEKKELEAERLKQQNLYEEVQVPLLAFDKQFNNMMAANQQAVTAIKDDPRTLIGAIQGVQNATVQGQSDITDKLSDKIYTDAMTKAGAGMAINQDLAKLYLDQAQGAQVAAMAAEKAMVAQQQAALQGVGGLATQGMGMIGTYGGFANEGDKLQTLLGGTSFAKPATQNAQGMDPKMMQAFAQFLKTYKV